MSGTVAGEGGLEVRVRAVAKALTKEEERATKLRLAGYSTAQIADAMGQDEATVRRWLTKVQELVCADARRAAETPVEPVAIPPRRQVEVEWEARLAALAGYGAARRAQGIVSGKELMVIVLRLEGQRECDMARQLGASVGAVNMRLVRARRKLAERAPELARQLWSHRSRR